MTALAPHEKKHPVNFPGDDSAGDIATGLALVRVCKTATLDAGWVDTEVIEAISLTLDLAERFLAAGAAWARATQNELTEADWRAAESKGRVIRAKGGAI